MQREQPRSTASRQATRAQIAAAKRTKIEADIGQRLQAGYGKGEHSEYQPWQGARDAPCTGTAVRLWSPKTARMMQFQSTVERDLFLTLEYRTDFHDYWERYPLDRYLTVQAAANAGIPHPLVDRRSKAPKVLTLNGLYRQKLGNSGMRKIAFSCKFDASTLPKWFEKEEIIKRNACEIQGIEHVLVSRNTLPEGLIENLLWIRGGIRRQGEIERIASQFDRWPALMLKEWFANRKSNFELTTQRFCKEFALKHAIPADISVRLMKQLLWNHDLEADLNAGPIINQPVQRLRRSK